MSRRPTTCPMRGMFAGPMRGMRRPFVRFRVPPCHTGISTGHASRRRIDASHTCPSGYLPARRRLTWMRGEPVPHPDWTVDTYDEEVIRGDFSKGRITGGYARYRASVFDTAGRLIGTGTKTEYSERFTDFVEKAETGAIARALAVAGYGTEAALDLDEGYAGRSDRGCPRWWSPHQHLCFQPRRVRSGWPVGAHHIRTAQRDRLSIEDAWPRPVDRAGHRAGARARAARPS